jgi:hypothetical protein
MKSPHQDAPPRSFSDNHQSQIPCMHRTARYHLLCLRHKKNCDFMRSRPRGFGNGVRAAGLNQNWISAVKLSPMSGDRGIRDPSPNQMQPPSQRHITHHCNSVRRGALSDDTIREIFKDEPGVLCIGTNGSRRRRKYITMRIPESVAMRVHARYCAKPAPVH